jgi:mRNA interferase RelE/StbE
MTASRFLEDTAGMSAVVEAIDALADDPYPADSFRWGDMLRLRVGQYRIMYLVEGDLITIDRIDRAADR